MPSARFPVVEFRSLLSPPIRLPLRALHSLFRPQCSASQTGIRRPPQCLEQRRSLVLYKTAKATTVLGMHKLLPFDLYTTPPANASKHLVHLEVRVDGRLQVIKNISLQDIYDKHIRPGQLLYLKDGPTKRNTQDQDALDKELLPLQYRTFAILEAETVAGNKKEPHAGKGQGALRVTALGLSSPAAYFKIALDRSYQFIKHGSPVEFTMAITRKAEKDKKRRHAPKDPSSWHWTHEHFPHLRPDFILKSMPENSRFVVDPVSNGKVIQFVIAASQPQPLNLGYKPHVQDQVPLSLTTRLFRVKASVEKSIKEGKQAQLPSVLRQMLYDSGNNVYRKETGPPNKDERTAEAAQGMPDKDVWYDGLTPPPRNRYLPEEAEDDEQPVMRMDKLSKDGFLKGPTAARPYQVRKKKKGKLREPSSWEMRGQR